MAAPFEEPEEDSVVKPESLLLLLLMGGVLFLLFSRSRRQQRTAQQLQAGLSVGAQVMTTAGLYATVVQLEDGVVVLETSPGQTSRWDRRAIARVLPEEPAPKTDTYESAALDTEAGRGDENSGVPGTPTRGSARELDDGAAGTALSSQESAPPERS